MLDRLKGDPVALGILGVNTAIGEEAAAQGWAYVGYKGGSEPGVVNMSWLLRDSRRRLVRRCRWAGTIPKSPSPRPSCSALPAAALATVHPAGG